MGSEEDAALLREEKERKSEGVEELMEEGGAEERKKGEKGWRYGAVSSRRRSSMELEMDDGSRGGRARADSRRRYFSLDAKVHPSQRWIPRTCRFTRAGEWNERRSVSPFVFLSFARTLPSRSDACFQTILLRSLLQLLRTNPISPSTGISPSRPPLLSRLPSFVRVTLSLSFVRAIKPDLLLFGFDLQAKAFVDSGDGLNDDVSPNRSAHEIAQGQECLRKDICRHPIGRTVRERDDFVLEEFAPVFVRDVNVLCSLRMGPVLGCFDCSLVVDVDVNGGNVVST